MILRHIKPLIFEALQDFPVVAILGSRQVGKSTLASDLPSSAWPAKVHTLDDLVLLEAALRDPDGFIDGLDPPVILDEVQRAVEVLRSIKRVVDRRRDPGMFVLTGSANLMTMKSVSESLAGRVALFELDPFSWSELHSTAPPSTSIDRLFSCADAREFIQGFSDREAAVSRTEIIRHVLAGGYPIPSRMKPGRNRTRWFQSYKKTYLERDLREVSNVIKLPEFARLLTTAASYTGKLLNTAALARDLGVPHNTVRRHLGLLETTYQVNTLQPYFVNIGKRLVKTPKLYFNDTGLAASLLAVDDWNAFELQGRAGAMVETWVDAELRKALALCDRITSLFFWRTHAGREVDFLLERGERLAAIEVKWAQRIQEKDLAGMESCRGDLGDRLGLGVVLYTGQTSLALDKHTAAVPITTFFEGARKKCS